MEQKTWRMLFLVGVCVFVAAFFLTGESFRGGPAQVFALILVMVGYVAGFLAIAIQVVLLFFGFILSLPLISTVYAAVLAFIAKLHYILFKSIFKSGLKKTPMYQKTEKKVKESRAYKSLSKHLHRFLDGLGIKRPKHVHMFEMDRCPQCNEEIPGIGRFCPYCGALREEKAV